METKEIKLDIPIPEGKEFDRYILDGDTIKIQYKDKWTPKDGDFAYVKSSYSESILIYKADKYKTSFYLLLEGDKLLYENGYKCPDNDLLECRQASKKEKQKLLNVLHEEGKDWDPVKKEIVKYRWKPNIQDRIYYIDLLYNKVRLEYWTGNGCHLLFYDLGLVYKTEEEAQKVLEFLKESLKKYNEKLS